MRNLIDLSDFRTAYSQQLGDVDLQAARAMHAFLSSFDDHEIRNDWVSDRDNWKLGLDAEDPDSPPPEVFMLKKQARSEEHTSELQSLMRTSYAVFCFKK